MDIGAYPGGSEGSFPRWGVEPPFATQSPTVEAYRG
jgi:hypothetical protein